MPFLLRIMRVIPALFIMAVSAQEDVDEPARYLEFDFSVGLLGDSNSNFPEHSAQKSFFVGMGKRYAQSEKAWAYYLNSPKVGILLGFSDLGNRRSLGYAYSVLPYAEFSLLPAKTDRLHLLVAFGASYLDRVYDAETNPNNKGVSTRLNWAYRSYLYYDFFKGNKGIWRAGIGYLHHSNGHTRKPNRGYNAFLVGISSAFSNREVPKSWSTNDGYSPHKSKEWFYTTRVGVGQNSFSDVFNSKKEVFTAALSVGKIINKTFKFGGGCHYRFYEHYYDYIINEETLIRTQEPGFTEHPIANASNFGVFGSAELLLGHVGMEFDLGLNVFKPFYKIDWQLNEGYTTFNNGEENIVLGELGSYYQIKRYVFSRMGLKYYLVNTERSPKHNIFIGAFINANLGQADFSELTTGYRHRFGF
ncbi:acyloxyacyl hydrolase [Aggregatimonas sangjinii]|uniref:Acyloxyacyl hydrolase n=1 Tax=Aggregatimonas sangjinii TaxID=2583587 RepID=A0A5B7SQ29_9FLAO|nr:acyloxyacyl hydrolase [Aggregatimonas sangjinii]QCW99080.1 acyloxyacyl hydrolase [Aggregatimonas sangjinii]